MNRGIHELGFGTKRVRRDSLRSMGELTAHHGWWATWEWDSERYMNWDLCMLVDNDKSDYVGQEKGTNSTIVHLTIPFWLQIGSSYRGSRHSE